MANKKKLVLLDAHAIIHRAYHALPDFSSSKGEPTGALYGLSAMLIKIIQDLKPDYVAACFDLPKPTFRHEVFADYKGGRKKTDPELVVQLKKSREVFAAFNIPIYEAEGFEADDGLGTIVEQLRKEPIDIVIASGDMDTLQLVEEGRVSVYTLKKGITDTIIYDEKGVVERFGFHPDLLIDYKGLRGDPSDNIPGIRGIGEKTATSLIDSFGNLEKIYEASEEALLKEGFKPRIINLLTEGKDEAFFSKMLATIRRDAPITYEIPKDVWRESIKAESILNLFAELEFRTLGDRVKKLLGVEVEYEEEKVEEKIDEEQLRKAEIALWLINSDITNPTRADVMSFVQGGTFKEVKEEIQNK
ncbi:hypothetical protein COB52_00650 [Candidatus Kaiserbacteria bacterium]|nr:MAG: hypothetical protein COB52_00650 [Candidatus Kaiserbacteria bacterium]